MAVVCIGTNFTVMTVLVLTDFTKPVFHRYKQKGEKKDLRPKRLIQLKNFFSCFKCIVHEECIFSLLGVQYRRI